MVKVTKSKMSEIILDLIYLEDGLYHDKAVDVNTLKLLRSLIKELRFWRQFMTE